MTQEIDELATNKNGKPTYLNENPMSITVEADMNALTTAADEPPRIEMQKHVNKIVGNQGAARVPMGRASEIVARAIGCSPRKALDYFYARTDKIPSNEMDAARRAAAAKAQATHDEIAELEDRISRLEQHLNQVDQEFYSETVSAFRQMLGRVGKKDSA